MRPILPCAAALIVLALPAATAFAASAVQKECSAKYQAAKAANTLNGMNYREFYKQCSAQEKAEKAGGAAPAASTPATAPAPVAPAASPAATRAERAPVAPATAVSGNAVFPTAISPQYKSLSAGVARRKTCDDQYKINKASNGNGGLKWIEKGGGYYSECNKRLKG